ncbi:KilA-N domain-containing protein [Undibacterium sp. Jales W-56]|uniref:KilA-N domain-containing protein n=1 Tax=Undibacterium sp. Jales W-56 TaxID=2897325 RepID=UPI0021D25C46|nr:KilA-N domain-containing protein [Undibacterium sp. Jales W-56]MCU6435461.1 KilA-N domain-containing protein [Undibacterium sp. Jales W-56]
MKTKLQVLDQQVGTYTQNGIEYICITDIARFKNSDRTDDLIRNWSRNRNATEFLGI